MRGRAIHYAKIHVMVRLDATNLKERFTAEPWDQRSDAD